MRKTFVTSDLHLGHFNIIKYSKRPFNSLEEMNKKLTDNWNNTISRTDNVYFLGDLAYGHREDMDKWISELNGNIIFIKGNHDKSYNISLIDSAVVTFDDISFFLVHDPNDIPSNWDGWVIHGHHHNNFPDQYPFFNQRWRMFNVSVEWTDYKPVDIKTILKLIRDNK